MLYQFQTGEHVFSITNTHNTNDDIFGNIEKIYFSCRTLSFNMQPIASSSSSRMLWNRLHWHYDRWKFSSGKPQSQIVAYTRQPRTCGQVISAQLFENAIPTGLGDCKVVKTTLTSRVRFQIEGFKCELHHVAILDLQLGLVVKVARRVVDGLHKPTSGSLSFLSFSRMLDKPGCAIASPKMLSRLRVPLPGSNFLQSNWGFVFKSTVLNTALPMERGYRVDWRTVGSMFRGQRKLPPASCLWYSTWQPGGVRGGGCVLHFNVAEEEPVSVPQILKLPLDNPGKEGTHLAGRVKCKRWSWAEASPFDPLAQFPKGQQWIRRSRTGRCCRSPSTSPTLRRWPPPAFAGRPYRSYHKPASAWRSLGFHGHVLSGCSLQQDPQAGLGRFRSVFLTASLTAISGSVWLARPIIACC